MNMAIAALTTNAAPTERVIVRVATRADREEIYRLRHAVYAEELGQHPVNNAESLTDALDEYNVYIVAKTGDAVAGFISITPPEAPSWSIDKYFVREELPFTFDESVYEVRLLTIARGRRGSALFGLLMYAALRWVEARGGRRIVAIGRTEILDMYCRVGFTPLGLRCRCGAVEFELISASTAELRARLAHFRAPLRAMEKTVDWRLEPSFRPPAPCFHGGAFFEAVGERFDRLPRAESIVNADVLDAWFPPCPEALDAVREFLPWLARTSPPTQCAGMVETIAERRGVPSACVLPGAGSSDLIYLALREWLGPDSRVLILDPTYGEYAHVLEQVIGCRVDRFTLKHENSYDIDLEGLASRLRHGYDLVVLVNPNSPTGRLVPGKDLEAVVRRAPLRTRFWIDETYVDYAGAQHSLERFAAGSRNVIVCKSMSKAYALSGLRAAYLCGAKNAIEALRGLTPPWAVSLPAQVAAVAALNHPAYYQKRYEETHALRAQLTAAVRTIDERIEIVPAVANFILCHFPPDMPSAREIVESCQEQGVFVRDVSSMGAHLGDRAIRIAVKHAAANARIVSAISSSI